MPVQLVDSDDAIVVPEDLQGGRRSLAWLTVALFLVLCVGTLVIDVAWPAPRLVPIGAEAAREAALESSAKFSDGSLAALTERRLRSTSRVRRTVGTPYALALYELANFTHGDVLAGTDGWLFQLSRTCATRSEKELRERLQLHTSLLASLSLRLAAVDTQLILLPIPRKEVMHGDRLPREIETRAWAETYVIELLRARQAPHVELADAWSKARPQQQFSHRAGSHWTQEAERIAAEEIARVSGKWVEPELRRTTIHSPWKSKPDCDLLVIAGVEVDVARASLPPDSNDAYEVNWKSNGQRAFLENDLKGAQLAVVGTSFTDRRIMWRLLAHAVDEPVALFSAGGGEPATQLLRLLEQTGGTPPRHVVYEVPMHLLLQSPPSASLEALAVQLAAPAHTELLGFQYKRAENGKLELELSAARTNISALVKDELFQDGAGWAHVRLRGTTGPTGARVILRTTDTVREYDWPAERTELFVAVPALATRSQDVLVSVSARPGGGGRLTLDSAHLVALGERVLHRFAPAAPSSGQELTPQSLPLEAERIALVLKLNQPATGVGMTSATFSVHHGGELVTKRDVALREGVTTVVLDASELRGREQLSFRLESSARPVGLVDGMLLTVGRP